MPRARKPRSVEIPMNVDLPADLATTMDNFCETYKIKKKQCVELALRQFLNRMLPKGD